MKPKHSHHLLAEQENEIKDLKARLSIAVKALEKIHRLAKKALKESVDE